MNMNKNFGKPETPEEIVVILKNDNGTISVDSGFTENFYWEAFDNAPVVKYWAELYTLEFKRNFGEESICEENSDCLVFCLASVYDFGDTVKNIDWSTRAFNNVRKYCILTF